MEKESKEKYVGKTVQLFPGDTYWKRVKIVDVDDLGWTFEVLDSDNNASSEWARGNILFFNHASEITFRKID